MANYLPVLLVSLNTNSIPDDNVLTTFPCGQVDYLSHDWLEEDVWRSWRNMTRQKNEITNGLRLENASWRTWWKQRNKLKTVSPETLNWLKDSDVTWLYGPLHTGVDWLPPPKPVPVPDSVDSGGLASTQDRLDLHSVPSPSSRHHRPPPTKPILKHRSISELLTSDLPVSPIFSPQESEDESNLTCALDPKQTSSLETPKRPCLPHTKSDTHITRWGLSRTSRKDSPSRVEPSSSSERPSSRQSTVRASGAVRNSLSQDSTSSASASGSSERTAKKKHITFNTFVEQCIAIDKHPRNGSRRTGFGFGDYGDHEYDHDEEDEGKGEKSCNGKWEDDDGYEEDREDNLFDDDDSLWLAAHGGPHPRRRHLNGSAIHSDSDSDDGAIEIRPSTYRQSNLATPHPKKKATPRSQSVSSSSSTTTTTTSTTSSSTDPRPRRKSASAGTNIPHLLSAPGPVSSYRPRPPHPSQFDQSYRDRVTIAPIAPTFLKTTGAWEEGFGDEGGASDDGLWDFNVPRHGINNCSGDSGKSRRDVGDNYEEEQVSYGTPVELVYVPPFGSVYGYGAATYWRRNRGEAVEDEGEEEWAGEEEGEKSQLTASNQEDETAKNVTVQEVELDIPTTLVSPPSISTEPSASVSKPPVPVVVIDSSPDSDSTPHESPEWNHSNSSNFTSTSTQPVPVPLSKSRSQEEEGRGRSLSISPAGRSGSNSKTIIAASSSSPNNGLLTSRGRSQSCQDLQSFCIAPVAATSIQGSERRGRSGVRGTSNIDNGSSSGIFRGINPSQSNQSHTGGRRGGSVSTSPIGGSLSPDGSDARLGGMGGAYASGRTGGRGRERVERVSSNSSLSSKATSVASDERRGRDRGRRDIGPGSESTTMSLPEERRQRGRSGRYPHGRTSLSPHDIVDTEPASLSSSPTPTDVIKGEGKGKYKELVAQAETDISRDATVAQKMELDASICSVSSEGSTATIVPASNMVTSTPKASGPVNLDILASRERQFVQEATEESDPKPSYSPLISMTAPCVGQTGTTASPPLIIPPTKQPTEHPLRHARTAPPPPTHSQNIPSKPKAKSLPPIILPLPLPSFPSTSPSYAPGEVSPSIGFTGLHGRSASTSLERASSGSRERYSVSSPTTPSSALRKEITYDMEHERELAEARRGRNSVINGASANENTDAGMGWRQSTSPVLAGHGERETIIDKAVGMVSNAGAYLRLWPNQGGAQ